MQLKEAEKTLSPSAAQHSAPQDALTPDPPHFFAASASIRFAVDRVTAIVARAEIAALSSCPSAWLKIRSSASDWIA
ncbi:MAG TPA: hypothetical protein VLX85_11150 [Stellaceae bacterium]|nr:hypothetical protein [Stellaceae bacterium]